MIITSPYFIQEKRKKLNRMRQNTEMKVKLMPKENGLQQGHTAVRRVDALYGSECLVFILPITRPPDPGR